MFCSKCGNTLDNQGKCSICDNTNITSQATTVKKDNTNLYKVTIIAFLFIIIALLGVLLLSDDKKLSGKNQKVNIVQKDVLKENGNVSRTIMIYMVGSNLESDNGIATADIASIDPKKVDLEHMDILLYTGGTKEWHNFVKNDENAIYHLTKDGFEKIETYEKLNMGSSSTLESFLTYGYEKFKNDRYDLIFYDHGGAIDGAIYDDFTKDNLSLIEFQEALDKSPFNVNNRLETVLFRTCLNGTLEVANVFDEYAYYLIASEEVTNGGGNTSVLNFLNEIDKDSTAIDYGKKYIEAYDEQMKHYFLPSDHPMMYSIIDLNKIDDIWSTFEDYISKVDIDNNFGDIVRLRDSLFQFGYSYYNEDNYDMIDLYSLVEGLKPYGTEDSKKLLDMINDAVIYNWSSSDSFHGLSIYFPYRGTASVKIKFLSAYKKWGIYENYNKFINAFNEKSSSNNTSSFSSFSPENNDTEINNGNEFKVKLTDEQVKDYGNSIYIIFVKNKDGLYRPVYSSDNATLSDGYLKTNIENNLIKVRDKSDGTEDFITLIERSKNGNKVLTSAAVLQYIPGKNEEFSKMKTTAVNVYYDFKNGKPYVTSYVSIGDNGAAGSIEEEKNYNRIDYFTSGYKIFDENGKYTDKWENDDTLTGYEFKFEDIVYEKATINKNEDYYCVFKIQDIYGNIYYSDFMSLKK